MQTQKPFFEEFFVCPHCGEPTARVRKSQLKDYMMRCNPKYCRLCGENIANTLSEALASLDTSDS